VPDILESLETRLSTREEGKARGKDIRSRHRIKNHYLVEEEREKKKKEIEGTKVRANREPI